MSTVSIVRSTNDFDVAMFPHDPELDLESEIVKLIRDDRKLRDDQLTEYKRLLQALQSQIDAIGNENLTLRSIVEGCSNCKGRLERMEKSDDLLLKPGDFSPKFENPGSSQKHLLRHLMMTQYSSDLENDKAQDDDDDGSGTIILSSPVRPLLKLSPFKLPSASSNVKHEHVFSPIVVPIHMSTNNDSPTPINDENELDLVKAGSDSQRSDLRLLESEFGPSALPDFHVKPEPDSQGARGDGGTKLLVKFEVESSCSLFTKCCDQPFERVPVDQQKACDLPSKSRVVSHNEGQSVLEDRDIVENPDAHGNPDIIEDLDTEQPLKKPFTGLQKRQIARQHLSSALHLSSTTIHLAQNPVTKTHWVITDFKRNPNYMAAKSARTSSGAQGPSGFTKRRVAMTMEEEANQKRFYRMANGQISDHQEENPYRTTNAHAAEDSHNDPDSENFEQIWSQIHEKLPSPPGFMQSEFPNTQETHRRRTLVVARQQRRIQRRIAQCLIRKMGIQCGEFIFTEDVLNAYILAGRYTK